jgi:hypothetical protein
VTTGLNRQRDFFDPDFRETLAVADELADALLGLVLEDEDLLVFGLAQDGPRDDGAADDRCADAYRAPIRAQDHAIEGNRGADFLVDEVGADDVAFGNAQLLAAGLNDRVHNRGILSEPGLPVNEHLAAVGAM